MNIPERFPVSGERIRDFCRRNQIQKLGLFGSVLREDFTPDSDIDILVEFRENARVGLFSLMRMKRELEEAVHRKIDIRTPKDLSPYFRERVVSGAELLYDGE